LSSRILSCRKKPAAIAAGLHICAILNSAPKEAGDQGDDEQHDSDPKQELSACHRRTGHAAESKHRGHDSNDQKHNGPVKKIAHSGSFPFALITSAIAFNDHRSRRFQLWRQRRTELHAADAASNPLPARNKIEQVEFESAYCMDSQSQSKDFATAGESLWT
jgi:hypothetical protein